MLDLDGTIVHGGVEVFPRVRKALRQAADEGCKLVVCTGRPLGMVPRSVRRLGVMAYYLCANGATVYDAKGAELLSRTMSNEDVRRMMDEVAPLGPGWNVHSDGQSWIERTGVTYMVGGARGIRSRIRKYFPRSPRQVRSLIRGVMHFAFGEQGKTIVPSIRPVIDSHERFEKVVCSFTTDEACEEAILRIEALGGFQVARVWARELEITAAGVTKGTACDWLLDYLGEDKGRSVAFGDSMNDAPLIGHVGRFVAMGNASAELKALCDEVCASLTEDGVALWLEEQMTEAHTSAGMSN